MEMAEAAVPYLSAYGNITKVLDRIKTAQGPSAVQPGLS
jgi:hypothetical protein